MKQETLHFQKSHVCITKHVKTGRFICIIVVIPAGVVLIWGSSTKTVILLFSSLLFTAFEPVYLDLLLLPTEPIHHLLPLMHAETKQVLDIT